MHSQKVHTSLHGMKSASEYPRTYLSVVSKLLLLQAQLWCGAQQGLAADRRLAQARWSLPAACRPIVHLHAGDTQQHAGILRCWRHCHRVLRWLRTRPLHVEALSHDNRRQLRHALFTVVLT